MPAWKLANDINLFKWIYTYVSNMYLQFSGFFLTSLSFFMFSWKSPSMVLAVLVNDLRTRMGRSPKVHLIFLGLTFLLRISNKTVIITKQTSVCIELDWEDCLSSVCFPTVASGNSSALVFNSLYKHKSIILFICWSWSWLKDKRVCILLAVCYPLSSI